MKQKENSKENLKQKIREVLNQSADHNLDLSNKGVDELVAEVSIYHQELEYQNEELMRIRDELEISKEHFRSLYNEAPIGYLLCSEDLKIQSANSIFCNLISREEKDIKKTKITDYIHPDSQDDFYFHLRDLLKHNISKEDELYLISATTSLQVKIISNTYIEEKQKFIRIAFIDISKEKKFENALLKSQQKFKSYIESTPTPIFIANSEGKYIYVNPSACDLLGYSYNELTNLSVLEVVKQADDYIHSLWKKVSASEHLSGAEIVLKKKNGEEVYALLDSIKISENEIIGFVVNITSRRYEEEKYRTIISTSIDGFFIVDMNGKFLETNETYTNMIGYSTFELTSGMGLSDIEANEDPDDVRNHINKIIELGSDRFITKQKSKSGKIIDLEISTTFLPSQKHLVVFSRDITDELKRKNQLVQNEKLLTQAQRAANMGHYELDISTGKWTSSEVFDRIFEIDKSYDKSVDGWVKLIHPDFVHEMKEYLLEHVIKNRNPFDKEYKIIGQKSGNVKWVYGKGELTFDEKGNVESMFGVVQDINDRKLASEQIKEQKDKLHNIIEATNVGTWEWNVQTNGTVFNEKWAEIIGYTLEELQPININTWTKQVHPEDLEISSRKLKEHFEGKSDFYECEARMKHKNGNWVWVLDRGQVLEWSSDGKPIKMFGTHTDITDKKRFEETIKESNLRFALATESAGIAVWDWDVKNNVLTWDDKMHELYEVDKNNFEGAYSAWSSALHKDDKDRLNKEINLALEGVKEYDTEFKIHIKDGKVKYLRAFAKTLRDPSGNAIRMIGVNYDITELKKAQEDLVSSEQRFKIIFDDSFAVMFIIDPETQKFVDCNKAAEKFYGYSKEDFTNLKVSDVNLNNEEAIDRDIKHAVNNKGGRFEFKHRLANGKIRDVEVFTSPIIIHGKPYLNSIVHDITDRKRAQYELVKTEKRYRNFFENDLTGDYLTTIEGKILDCNPAFVKILGYDSRDELLNTNSTDLYPEKADRDEFLKLIYSKRALTNHEIKLKKKDGTIIHCLENCNGIFDDEGNLMNLQGYLYDITEEKLAEDKLKKSEQEKTKVLNSTLSGLYIYNFVDRQYEYINPAYSAITGWSIQELNSKLNSMSEKFYDLFYPDDFDKVYDHFIRLTESKVDKIFSLEYRFKSKEGDWIWLLSYDRVYERDENGKVTKFIGSFIDNSKQKEVELALRESEERFRLIFDNINNVAVHGYKPDGTIHYWNKSSEILYGYSQSEAIGKKLYDLIIPDSIQDQVKKSVKKMFESQEPLQPEELLLKKKDGSLVPVFSNHTIVNVMGKQKELYCIDIDLTDRKKAENELKFQARLLSEIGEAVIATNSEGKVIYWNRAAELLYGWQEKEVISRPILEVNTSNQSAEVAAVIMSQLLAGNRWSGELQLIKKNGESFDAFVTDSPFFDENNNLVGIIGVSKDITELKKVEKDLRAKNEFIQTVLDNLPIGIALNQINSGKAFYMNKKFEEIYGWPEENMREIAEFFERVYPDEKYRNELVTKIMTDINSGDKERMRWENIEIRTKNNESRRINAQNIPLFDQNTMVSTVLDVTAEKNAEKILVESQRLSAIGEMSSAIAHDFNNALQSILGNLDLSLIHLNENHPSKRYLETIRHATSDAAARVRLLQRFAGESRSKDTFTLLDVNQLLEDVVQQLRPLWKDTKEKEGVKFEMLTDFTNNQTIFGNEGEIRSVIYNVLKNSIEAMPVGGKIKIKTYQKSGYVIILIVDDGIGMDEKTKARVFQPFFSTKGFESGRGLGMSGAYSIIQEHSGNIFIKESSPNKGTSLVIELPAYEGKGKSEIDKIPVRKYEGSAKILWVDDDGMIRDVAKEILSLLGYDGKVVASGYEAIEELNKDQYDLVVTDIGMPGMNGWELINRIKESINDKLKIAVLTGWGDQIGDKEKQKYKIQYVISKPFDIDQLNSMISSILASE